MLDYDGQRKAITIFVLGVVLVIIVTIFVLIFIWIPKEEKEEKQEYKVGIVESKTIQESDVVNKYYDEIYVLILNNDIDRLYELLSTDYIEYNEYDKDKITEYLRNKEILGKSLELVQYESIFLIGYNNVYSLDLKVKNEAYSLNVIIKETAPEEYTISFDKFIDYSKNVYDETINMNIYAVVRYVNSVEYDFKLTNNYSKEVKINSSNAVTPILLVSTQEKSKRPIMTTLPTSEIVFKSKESRNFKAVFNIEDVYDYITYNTLVLKNIEYTGIVGTSNLEFTMFK